jgi:phosphopantothenoylcysteine decarboxylase/phosphopantothenate--cysteine ligase
MIATAAVTDFRVDGVASHKIKKENMPATLSLLNNLDIIAHVANLPIKPFIMGFAAETDNLHEYAKQKLIQKNIDIIFANYINQPGTGFKSDDNEGIALWREGEKQFSRMPKKQLAKELLNLIGEQL